MKSRKKGIILSVVLIFAIIITALLLSFNSVIKKPFTIEKDETIVIEQGEGFYGTLNKLDSEGKVKNITFIKLYSKLKGLNLEVLPGEYTLSADMSLKEFLDVIKEGEKIPTVNVTIPEGFTIEDIGLKLESLDLCTVEEFTLAVESYPLPSYVSDNPEKRYNLEGFLFPDTYTVELDATPNEIIATMIRRFEEVWAKSTEGLNIADNEIEKIITIAAMIEKEAQVDKDRELISSVIYNRIDINMPLQIDATVIYAHGYDIKPVLYKHLEIDSPYNTYLHNTLPVGPISNPGVESIVAALNPVESNYLFYLVKGEGEHFFTNNYDEFLKKKEELGY